VVEFSGYTNYDNAVAVGDLLLKNYDCHGVSRRLDGSTEQEVDVYVTSQS